MSKTEGAMRRAKYTLEFKLEAVRLVKAGQEASVTAPSTAFDQLVQVPRKRAGPRA